jgi:hypothetical protein
VTFNEIRLVNSPTTGTGLTFNLREELVATDGIELSYKWQDRVWETTLRNPNPNLINPEEFHRPNLAPPPASSETSSNLVRSSQGHQVHFPQAAPVPLCGTIEEQNPNFIGTQTGVGVRRKCAIAGIDQIHRPRCPI